MAILKVQGHSSLVKETRTKAIINTNTNEYNIYMARIKQRNEQNKPQQKKDASQILKEKYGIGL